MNHILLIIILLLAQNIAFGRRLDGVYFTTAQNALGHLFSVSIESAVKNLIDVDKFYIVSTNSHRGVKEEQRAPSQIDSPCCNFQTGSV